MEPEQASTPQPFADILPFTGELEQLPQGSRPPGPLMRSQTQYHTAVSVQKPRDLDRIVRAVFREAEFAGEAFYWSWPVKNRKTGKVDMLEGPSIGLAMAVAREWTNCAVPIEYYETLTEWVFTSHFVDLEKGFTVSRVFRKRKSKGSFKAWEDDRAEDMIFQAAQSRAIRNVVCAGVPRWLLEQAMALAKEAVTKKITPEKLAEASEKAVKFFAGYGVQEEQIVAVLGVPRVQWGSKEIVTLRGMVSQLKDGQASSEQLFPPVEPHPEPPREEGKGKRSRPAKAAGPASSSPPGSLLPQSATPEQLEAIRVAYLEKGVDLELILQQWQISSLEELTEESAQQVRAWLERQ